MAICVCDLFCNIDSWDTVPFPTPSVNIASLFSRRNSAARVLLVLFLSSRRAVTAAHIHMVLMQRSQRGWRSGLGSLPVKLKVKLDFHKLTPAPILSCFVRVCCSICLFVFSSNAPLWHFKAGSVGVDLRTKKTRSARKLILAFRQYEILISLSVFGVVCLHCLLEAEFKFTHPPGNQSLGRSMCKCCLSSLSLQILPQVFPQVQPELSKERRKPTRHEEISGKNVCSPFLQLSLSFRPCPLWTKCVIIHTAVPLL